MGRRRTCFNVGMTNLGEGGRGGWGRKEGGEGWGITANTLWSSVGFLLFSQTTTSYEYLLLILTLGYL